MNCTIVHFALWPIILYIMQCIMHYALYYSLRMCSLLSICDDTEVKQMLDNPLTENFHPVVSTAHIVYIL